MCERERESRIDRESLRDYNTLIYAIRDNCTDAN